MRIQSGTDSIFALLAARQSSAARGNVAEQTESSPVPATGGDGVVSQTAPSYDFTRMTPNEMSELANEWFKAGDIDLTQLLMLQTAGVPFGKIGSRGEFVPLTETENSAARSQPVDYFQVTQGAMDFIEHSGKANDPTSGYERWKGIMATLQQKTAGVDLLA